VTGTAGRGAELGWTVGRDLVNREGNENGVRPQPTEENKRDAKRFRALGLGGTEFIFPILQCPIKQIHVTARTAGVPAQVRNLLRAWKSECPIIVNGSCNKPPPILRREFPHAVALTGINKLKALPSPFAPFLEHRIRGERFDDLRLRFNHGNTRTASC
jgi:hypothetical protein